MPRVLPRRPVYYDDRDAGVKRRVYCLACLDRRWVFGPPMIGQIGTKVQQPCRTCGTRRLPEDAHHRKCAWCEPRRIAAAIAADPKPEIINENPPWSRGSLPERIPCARCMGMGVY